jgi:hypothetical protein
MTWSIAYKCINGHVHEAVGRKQTHRQTDDSPAEYEDCCLECGSLLVTRGKRCDECGAWSEEEE